MCVHPVRCHDWCRSAKRAGRPELSGSACRTLCVMNQPSPSTLPSSILFRRSAAAVVSLSARHSPSPPANLLIVLWTCCSLLRRSLAVNKHKTRKAAASRKTPLSLPSETAARWASYAIRCRIRNTNVFRPLAAPPRADDPNVLIGQPCQPVSLYPSAALLVHSKIGSIGNNPTPRPLGPEPGWWVHSLCDVRHGWQCEYLSWRSLCLFHPTLQRRPISHRSEFLSYSIRYYRYNTILLRSIGAVGAASSRASSIVA